MTRGFAAQGNLGAVEAEDARIAAGGRMARRDEHAGNKTEFHKPIGKVGGEVDALEHGFLAATEVGQIAPGAGASLIDTHLHLTPV
jgi:hypothetical protein